MAIPLRRVQWALEAATNLPRRVLLAWKCYREFSNAVISAGFADLTLLSQEDFL